MPIPSHHEPRNVRWSVLRHFKLAFADAYPEYGVDYDEEFFDADAKQLGAVRDRWVKLRALEDSAGQKGVLLLQVDCFGRVGSRERRTTDEFGWELARMVQRVRAAFMVRSIPVYDFASATDRESPDATGHCCFVQSSQGVLRAPDGYARQPTVDGVRHEVLTYRIRTPFDAAYGHVYDF